MNNRGFTLTELLAVIAILAVISTIAGFSYTKIMKDNRIKQCEQKVLFIEKQAIKYASDDQDRIPSLRNGVVDNDDNVSINELVKSGYLFDGGDEDDILNPINNIKFIGKVNLKKEKGLITAEYGVDCE